MRRTALALGFLLLASCSREQAGQLKLVTPTAAPTTQSTTTAALPSSSAPAAVSADQIVLSLDELNSLTSTAKYRGGPDLADARSPFPAEGEVDPKECQTALRGLQNKLVAGNTMSSFRAVESVTVGDPALPEAQRRKDDFVQVVAVYSGEDAAREVFTTLAAGVGSCRDRKAADVDPDSGAKTEYDIKIGERSPTKVQWSQHQAGWDQYQRCVLEARLVKNVVLQDIECGLGTQEAPVGGLLPRALSKAAGRIP